MLKCVQTIKGTSTVRTGLIVRVITDSLEYLTWIETYNYSPIYDHIYICCIIQHLILEHLDGVRREFNAGTGLASQRL